MRRLLASAGLIGLLVGLGACGGTSKTAAPTTTTTRAPTPTQRYLARMQSTGILERHPGSDLPKFGDLTCVTVRQSGEAGVLNAITAASGNGWTSQDSVLAVGWAIHELCPDQTAAFQTLAQSVGGLDGAANWQWSN